MGTAAELQHMNQGGRMGGSQTKAEPGSAEGGGGEFRLKDRDQCFYSGDK